MRCLIAIATLLGASPALANAPGADYCKSKYMTCLANAVGERQADYCRANMGLCMKRPPAHRSADEPAVNPWTRNQWTTTVKQK